MLMSLHDRRPRLRGLDRSTPVRVPLVKMPPRRKQPDALAMLTVALCCVLVMLIALLVRGGR